MLLQKIFHPSVFVLAGLVGPRFSVIHRWRIKNNKSLNFEISYWTTVSQNLKRILIAKSQMVFSTLSQTNELLISFSGVNYRLMDTIFFVKIKVQNQKYLRDLAAFTAQKCFYVPLKLCISQKKHLLCS